MIWKSKLQTQKNKEKETFLELNNVLKINIVYKVYMYPAF